MSELSWHELDVCDSTNDELARLAASGAAAGTVVIATRQRAGRGRQGRAWASDEPGNLYASILLRPALPLHRVPPLSLVAGIAVARAVRARRAEATLKWPNDIVHGARKLGGLLAEASSRSGALEHVIIGIGLNLTSTPRLYSDIATSIVDAGGESTEPRAMMEAIAGELEEPLARYEAGGWSAVRDDYLELWRDGGRPATAEIDGRLVRGAARDIAESGALVIEGADGHQTTVVAGEVQIDYA